MPRISPYAFPGIRLRDLSSEVLTELGIIKHNPFSTNNILKVVSTLLDVEIDDIIGSSRRREVVEARQIALYQMRSLNGTSLKRMGEILGGRDHTTMIHNIKAYLENLEYVPTFRAKAEQVAEALEVSIV